MDAILEATQELLLLDFGILYSRQSSEEESKIEVGDICLNDSVYGVKNRCDLEALLDDETNIWMVHTSSTYGSSIAKYVACLSISTRSISSRSTIQKESSIEKPWVMH
ncbi:hypothetical protein TNCV_2194391 [Trichonephila clavipes]|uniref:Uncharacterized protein n=1 Tax=Trichonephila clavipes TaxID=2585209 RepID=A0A8X6SFQ1_TRICX|nr:hypothetical protein TNCV_2194391 [Trichonephila clavipes]